MHSISVLLNGAGAMCVPGVARAPDLELSPMAKKARVSWQFAGTVGPQLLGFPDHSELIVRGVPSAMVEHGLSYQVLRQLGFQLRPISHH